MKVMLAATLDDFTKVQWPMLASVKLDGIRAVILKHEGKPCVMSRNMKPIPNTHVQKTFGVKEMLGFDGELLVGDPWASDVFRKTSSAVMSKDGEPDVKYAVFDCVDNVNRKQGTRYVARLKHFTSIIEHQKLELRGVTGVMQHLMTSAEQVEEFFKEATENGFEGVMLRAPTSPYKNGRSTVNEGYLLKVKRFKDGEAEVVGWKELLHNDNPAIRNPLTGRLERSAHLTGKRGAGVLGALICKDLVTEQTFNIGDGFTAEDRRLMFIHPPSLVGRIAKYKFFPSGGKDKPRFPVFQGWRDKIDL